MPARITSEQDRCNHSWEYDNNDGQEYCCLCDISDRTWRMRHRVDQKSIDVRPRTRTMIFKLRNGDHLQFAIYLDTPTGSVEDIQDLLEHMEESARKYLKAPKPVKVLHHGVEATRKMDIWGED